MKRIAYGIVCILILLFSISCTRRGGENKDYVYCELCGEKKAILVRTEGWGGYAYYRCHGCKNRYKVDVIHGYVKKV